MIANEKAQMFKMSILFNLAYRFNRILTKYQQYVESDKMI